MADTKYEKKMLINLDMGNNEIIGFVPEVVTELPTDNLKVGRIVVSDTKAYICTSADGTGTWKELTSVEQGQAYVTEKDLFGSGKVILDTLIPTLEITKVNGLQDALNKKVETVVFSDDATAPSISGTTLTLPKKISRYDNDAGFINKDVNDLTNYLTTEAVKELIDDIKQFNVEVVDTLPETGKSSTIYFIPHSGETEGNIKDEYMWINNKWELIGTTEFSLTINQTNDAITINDTTLHTATSTQVGLMTKDQAGKLAGIEDKAEVNVIETVKVAGTALAVTDKAVNIEGTATPTEGSSALFTAGGAYSELEKKVDKLTDKPTAGAYAKVTINTEGQVTAGGSLDTTDIPNLDTSKVTSGTFDLARIPSIPYSKVTEHPTLYQRYTAVISGDGTATAFQVPTDSIENIASVVVLDSTGAEVIPAIIIGTEKVTVGFNTAPSSGTSYTVVLMAQPKSA